MSETKLDRVEWAYTQAQVHELDTNASYLLVTLATYTNPERKAYPSKRTLMAKMRVSEPTIRRSLRTLEGVGLLTTAEHFDKDRGGRQTSNRYTLRIATKRAVTLVTQTGEGASHRRGRVAPQTPLELSSTFGIPKVLGIRGEGTENSLRSSPAASRSRRVRVFRQPADPDAQLMAEHGHEGQRPNLPAEERPQESDPRDGAKAEARWRSNLTTRLVDSFAEESALFDQPYSVHRGGLGKFFRTSLSQGVDESTLRGMMSLFFALKRSSIGVGPGPLWTQFIADAPDLLPRAKENLTQRRWRGEGEGEGEAYASRRISQEDTPFARHRRAQRELALQRQRDKENAQ